MILKDKKLQTITYLMQFLTITEDTNLILQYTTIVKLNLTLKVGFLIPYSCVLLIKVNKLNSKLLCGIKSHKEKSDLKNFDLEYCIF